MPEGFARSNTRMPAECTTSCTLSNIFILQGGGWHAPVRAAARAREGLRGVAHPWSLSPLQRSGDRVFVRRQRACRKSRVQAFFTDAKAWEEQHLDSARATAGVDACATMTGIDTACVSPRAQGSTFHVREQSCSMPRNRFNALGLLLSTLGSTPAGLAAAISPLGDCGPFGTIALPTSGDVCNRHKDGHCKGMGMVEGLGVSRFGCLPRVFCVSFERGPDGRDSPAKHHASACFCVDAAQSRGTTPPVTRRNPHAA